LWHHEIWQAVVDGVDILSLSLGPNSPPNGEPSTFLNILDLALLNAVKANVFVVQAAGNGGPYLKTVTSFSPWVVTVGAGVDDRLYPNELTLGNGVTIPGVTLARKKTLQILTLLCVCVCCSCCCCCHCLGFSSHLNFVS
jgi:hypothetical protein